jgi:prevent-host-death family protein
MALIGSRTLQRNTKTILDDLERDGEPAVIVRHGRPVAALVPIDQEQAEALVLATSPEFRRRREAREAAAQPKTRSIEDVIRELDEQRTEADDVEADDEETGPTDETGRKGELIGLDQDDAGTLIDEVAQTLLGAHSDPAHGKVVELNPERVEALTSALQESVVIVDPGFWAAHEAITPTHALMSEIVQRQNKSSIMLASLLRTFIEQRIAVDAMLHPEHRIGIALKRAKEPEAERTEPAG